MKELLKPEMRELLGNHLSKLTLEELFNEFPPDDKIGVSNRIANWNAWIQPSWRGTSGVDQRIYGNGPELRHALEDLLIEMASYGFYSLPSPKN